jgi:hypothetical protein
MGLLGKSVLAVEIEGYRIESECPAHGGVRLFRARQVVADSPVLLQLWEGPAERARSAIRALAGLRHPGLATVLDVGETSQAQAYAALVALPGESLTEQLRSGLDLHQSIALLRRLALVLQFIESRTALSPCLDPEFVFADAHGRPVLTRLLADDAEPVGAPAPVRLLHLFHEALTGHVSDAAVPDLPEYLRRWQPLFDLLGEPAALSPQQLLRALDALQGRTPAAEIRPGASTSVRGEIPPTRPPQRGTPGQSGLQHGRELTDPILSSEGTLAVAATTPPAGPEPQKPERAAKSAASLPREPASPLVLTERPVAADERITAPARRVEKAAARAAPELRALGETALPAPPSRIPLLLAAVLALPLLAVMTWWMLFATGESTAEVSHAAEAPRPAAPALSPPDTVDPTRALGPAGPSAEHEGDTIDEWTPDFVGEIDLQALADRRRPGRAASE